MSESGFTLGGFFRDAILSLVRPWEYYPSMRREGGIGEPLLAACLYGILTGLINFAWSVHGLGMTGDVLGRIIGGGIGILSFMGSFIGALFFLFAGGIVIVIVSTFCGGNTAFEPSLRVSASLLVIMPVKALLEFMANALHGPETVLPLLVSLYGLWMLYHALKHALGCRARRAMAASIALSAVPVLFLLGGIVCIRTVGDFTRDLKTLIPTDPGGMMKQLPGSGKDMNEAMERLRKMMEEAQKNPKDQ